MNLALFQELRSESTAYKTGEGLDFLLRTQLWSKPQVLTKGPGRGWGCCEGPVPPRDSLCIFFVFLGQRCMAFSRCSEFIKTRAALLIQSTRASHTREASSLQCTSIANLLLDPPLEFWSPI